MTSVGVTPARLDTVSWVGDAWALELSFTEAGVAYEVTAADFTATLLRGGSRTAMTVEQVDASTLRVSLAKAQLSGDEWIGSWALVHTATARAWLAGSFRRTGDVQYAGHAAAGSSAIVVGSSTVDVALTIGGGDNATYMAGARRTIVLLGNSRIANELVSSASASQRSERGPFTWANARAGNRFDLVHIAGTSGHVLSDMAARWATDVSAYSPGWVLVADAVNDATADRTAAQMQADTETIIALARGDRVNLILLTVAPNNAHTAVERDELNAYNRWLRALDERDVVVVDVAASIIDPSNGNFDTAFAADGLHPDPKGAARMSKVLYRTLTNLLPERDPFPPPGDDNNAVSNPWASGTPGAGLPTSWTTSGSATYSTVARTDSIPGNWMQMDSSAAASDSYVRQVINPLPAGFAVGDTVQLLVEAYIDSLTTATLIEANVQMRDSASANVFQLAGLINATGDFPLADAPQGEPLIFASLPVEIPASVTQFNLLSRFSGQGIVRFGRHAILKVA